MPVIGFKSTQKNEVSLSNPNEGDLFLTGEGDIGTITDESDSDRIRAAIQGIKERLSLNKGDYFLNLVEGIPYFTDVFVKNPNIPLIRSIIRQAVLTYPGVIAITKLETSLNRATRQMTVILDITLDGGININSSNFGSVIIDLNLSPTSQG